MLLPVLYTASAYVHTKPGVSSACVCLCVCSGVLANVLSLCMYCMYSMCVYGDVSLCLFLHVLSESTSTHLSWLKGGVV